jgi:hypothetical protein
MLGAKVHISCVSGKPPISDPAILCLEAECRGDKGEGEVVSSIEVLPLFVRESPR